MKTFPLYGGSSLWRLFLFTGALRGVFSMETFSLYFSSPFSESLTPGEYDSSSGRTSVSLMYQTCPSTICLQANSAYTCILSCVVLNQGSYCQIEYICEFHCSPRRERWHRGKLNRPTLCRAPQNSASYTMKWSRSRSLGARVDSVISLHSSSQTPCLPSALVAGRFQAQQALKAAEKTFSDLARSDPDAKAQLEAAMAEASDVDS